VVVSIARRFFGDARVHGEIVRRSRVSWAGTQALPRSPFLERAAGPGIGVVPGGIAGIVAFVLGATAVFLQLQEALNRVWRSHRRPDPCSSPLEAAIRVVRPRTGGGFLLLVSLTLSTGLMALTDFVVARIPLPMALITVGNEVLFFLVLHLLIALIYSSPAGREPRMAGRRDRRRRDIDPGFRSGSGSSPSISARRPSHRGSGSRAHSSSSILWIYCASYIVLFGAQLTAVVLDRNTGASCDIGTGCSRAPGPIARRKGSPASGLKVAVILQSSELGTIRDPRSV